MADKAGDQMIKKTEDVNSYIKVIADKIEDNVVKNFNFESGTGEAFVSGLVSEKEIFLKIQDKCISEYMLFAYLQSCHLGRHFRSPFSLL